MYGYRPELRQIIPAENQNTMQIFKPGGWEGFEEI